MHINHRRGESRRFVHRRERGGYNSCSWHNPKVPDNRVFRNKERAALRRVKQGDEEVIFPTKKQHGDDIWNYD